MFFLACCTQMSAPIRRQKGRGGALAPPWATAAGAAVGPGGGREGGGGDRLGWGHIRRLYKAPTDYTKPRNIIQSPDRLYKDIERLCKAPEDYTFDLKVYTRP